MTALMARIPVDQLAELQRDAARYRWLRNKRVEEFHRGTREAFTPAVMISDGLVVYVWLHEKLDVLMDHLLAGGDPKDEAFLNRLREMEVHDGG